jgi:hypothetical protein
MSLAKSHSLTNSVSAFSMLGSEELTLNGTVIDAIISEVEYTKDYEETGFKPVQRFEAVVKTSDLPSGILLKKIGLLRGESFRVEGMRKGSTYTMVTLEEIHKA